MGRIADYVAKKYDEGPDIRLVVLRLTRPTLMPPADPIRESRSVLRIWEKEIYLHVKQKRHLEVNIGRLYALVMRQCTKALKAKHRILATFKVTNKNSDAIKIIKLIKIVAFKFEAHENIPVVTFVLKIRTVNLRQHDMSLIDYLKKF